VLAVGALGGIVAALAPRLAVAKPEDVAAAIKKLYGDKKAADGKAGTAAHGQPQHISSADASSIPGLVHCDLRPSV